MMDVVLGGGMGLVLALLLTSPPKPKKVRAVTAKVVEDAAEAETPPAKGDKKKKK
ncbi:MAG: hypothetical protein AB7G21_03480 [Dehalococcoidia bacterium]